MPDKTFAKPDEINDLTAHCLSKHFFYIQDPPLETWNCNNISVYLIHLNSKSADYGQKNAIFVSGDTPGNFKNVKSAVIPDLIPATEYCVTMSFTNGQEMHSPKSEEKCLVTVQTSMS